MNASMTVLWHPKGYEDVFRVRWEYGAKTVALEENVTVHSPYIEEPQWEEITPGNVPVGKSEFFNVSSVPLEAMDKFVREVVLSIDPSDWGHVDA